MTKKSTETFTLGHSPDPDDAFMFYAIAKNKIDLRGFVCTSDRRHSEAKRADAARRTAHFRRLDSYAYAANKYALPPCAASMANGYGDR